MDYHQKSKTQLIEEIEQLRKLVPANQLPESLDGKMPWAAHTFPTHLYLDLAGVIFLTIGSDQKVVHINRKGCEILDYSEEEIVGQNWFEKFVPPAVRAEVMAAFDRMMADDMEPVEYFQNAVLTGSGEERVIAWHNALVRNDQGQPVAALSSGIDITAQVRVQEELNRYKDRLEKLVEERTAQLKLKTEQHQQTANTLMESQIRFVGILDTVNESIISIDESQRIILFNKGAEQAFGYQASEVVGQPLELLLPARFAQQHHAYVNEFGHAPETSRLMGVRGEIFGRRKNGTEFPASASISKLKVGDRLIFTVVLRDITDRRQMEQEREQRIIELRALNESVRAISAELSLEQVLQKVTVAAQILMQAKYAALGLHDGEGRLSRFITVGVAPEEHDTIGPMPVGRGLLGHLLHQGESIIANDICRHPSASGFPENHPKMEKLLGVPIFSKNKLIGAIYLTDKVDGSKFTEADQQLVEMLTVHAAIAIENAQLYEQKQRLAILEERERFARDLHDGIIQSIYGVGLALDQAKMDIRPTNYAAREQIELSLKSLASVIKDIRNYIFDLRPQALRYKGLRARLDGLIKELRVNTLLPIHAEVDPNIDAYLTEMQSRHTFHITHEALSNAARHAKAGHITLRVTRDLEMVQVVVFDDGIGFTLKPDLTPGHHGLDNMFDRAQQLNGKLDIDSKPGRGTRLLLTFRLDSGKSGG